MRLGDSHSLVQISTHTMSRSISHGHSTGRGAVCQDPVVTGLQSEACLSACIKEPLKRMSSTLKLTYGMESKDGRVVFFSIIIRLSLSALPVPP